MFGWVLLNAGVLLLVPFMMVIVGFVVSVVKSDGSYLFLGGMGGFVTFWALLVMSMIIWGIVLISGGF